MKKLARLSTLRANENLGRDIKLCPLDLLL